jgi:hypothetical protein
MTPERGPRLMAVLLMFLCAAIPAVGQAQAVAPNIPRGPDGKPDLSGVWQVLNSAAWDLQDHSGALNMPPGQSVVEGGTIPYLPAAAAKQRDNFEHRETDDPAEVTCYLPGVPRATYMPFPFEIIQTPKLVVFSYEFAHARRHVFTDGSPHPTGFPDFWMGDSRGRWEGDTLVVDVTGFNDQTWFDRAGNFHSDALHVVERYTRVSPDVMSYEATIEDPKVFTRPWKMSMPLYRRQEPNAQLMDFKCVEFVEELMYGQWRKAPLAR